MTDYSKFEIYSTELDHDLICINCKNYTNLPGSLYEAIKLADKHICSSKGLDGAEQYYSYEWFTGNPVKLPQATATSNLLEDTGYKERIIEQLEEDAKTLERLEDYLEKEHELANQDKNDDDNRHVTFYDDISYEISKDQG